MTGARLVSVTRVCFLLALAAALAFFVVYTRHWQMLVDAPVMHYVNFLMSHGLHPYTQITDMNMPGSYLLERFGMTVFGGGDLGWRMYDFFLAAVTIISMAVIAGPDDWLAGVYAGGLFALRHGSEGAWFSGEREQEMMVLLITACALLFVAVRKQRPVVAYGFGLFAGIAACVKPTLVPFGLLTLPILYFALRARNLRPAPYVLSILGGLATPLVLTLCFFVHFQAFHAFLFVLRSVAPVYLGLNDPGWHFLVRHLGPDEWYPLVPFAALALVLRRSWNWERSVLLLGAACGMASYFFQHKGFFHQRYIFLGFAILLISLEIIPTDRHAWSRWLACGALLYATVFLLPQYVQSLRDLPGISNLTMSMEADLSRMGTDRLQREVQCFDLTFGCLNALYHLDLIENTGFTGDLLLFPLRPNPATTYYRDLFWKAQAEHPASAIVLTNQEFGADNSYARLERWPEFAAYLAQNYTLVVTRSFPYEDRFRGQPPLPLAVAPGYRIYLRKGQNVSAAFNNQSLEDLISPGSRYGGWLRYDRDHHHASS